MSRGSGRVARKVVILAPVHACDDIRVFYKEARSLARHGYRVVLMARAAENTERDGVVVHALATPGRRMFRFLRLPALLLATLGEKADVYHLHNPDTLPLAFLLKLFGKRVIYDSHEDFRRRILVRPWIPRMLRPMAAVLVSNLERLAGQFLNASIATQASVRERLGRKAILLENLPIVDDPVVEQAQAIAASVPEQPVFRVVYAGRLGRTRGLIEMVEAMTILNRTLTARLWLLGRDLLGDLPAAQLLPGWQYVDYLGQVPQHEAYAYMIRAHAGLMVIHDSADHRYTSPNKLYEYMLFRCPFVASRFTFWQEKLQAEKYGFFVDPLQPREIAEKLAWLAHHPEARAAMAERGFRFIKSSCNWEQEQAKLLALYDSVLGTQMEQPL